MKRILDYYFLVVILIHMEFGVGGPKVLLLMVQKFLNLFQRTFIGMSSLHISLNTYVCTTLKSDPHLDYFSEAFGRGSEAAICCHHLFFICHTTAPQSQALHTIALN